MRVFVGGLGYRNLRDHSLGLAVVERLFSREWPVDVVVEDASYNPIALVQRFEDEPPKRRFERLVMVAAVSRPGRDPGTLEAYRWDGALPDPERVQAAVADGVTGVISLDNTLLVLREFDALPRETLVVEVEPEAHEFGEAMSPTLARAFDRVCALVVALAIGTTDVSHLPMASLGGGRLAETLPRSG